MFDRFLNLPQYPYIALQRLAFVQIHTSFVQTNQNTRNEWLFCRYIDIRFFIKGLMFKVQDHYFLLYIFINFFGPLSFPWSPEQSGNLIRLPEGDWET